MSENHWVRRSDGLGEFSVDLLRCQRFVVSLRGRSVEEDTTEIYYLTPEGKWIEHRGDMWPPDDPETEPWIYGEFFNEADPVWVARILYKQFDGRLPPELEEYREIVADKDRFGHWMWDHAPNRRKENGVPVPSIKPSWDKDARTLAFAGRECRRYDRLAQNQFKILDALEAEDWTDKPVSVDGLSENQLRDTIKDINRSMHDSSPVEIVQRNSRVSWRLVSPSRSSDPP